MNTGGGEESDIRGREEQSREGYCGKCIVRECGGTCDEGGSDPRTRVACAGHDACSGLASFPQRARTSVLSAATRPASLFWTLIHRSAHLGGLVTVSIHSVFTRLVLDDECHFLPRVDRVPR
jgi:hypothetical protein